MLQVFLWAGCELKFCCCFWFWLTTVWTERLSQWRQNSVSGCQWLVGYPQTAACWTAHRCWCCALPVYPALSLSGAKYNLVVSLCAIWSVLSGHPLARPARVTWSVSAPREYCQASQAIRCRMCTHVPVLLCGAALHYTYSLRHVQCKSNGPVEHRGLLWYGRRTLKSTRCQTGSLQWSLKTGVILIVCSRHHSTVYRKIYPFDAFVWKKTTIF